MPTTTRPTHRLLRSSFVDLLVGPHGIDRYLELIRPNLTVVDARAEVVAVRHQTPRSVTLTLRPNAAFGGFTAGQFLRVGVEIDGVRRTRTFSPASSEHARDGRLELTITQRDGGLVTRHLRERVGPGTILHLDARGRGEFVLPDDRPERLVLISGGSGITPVLSMLRTLAEEGATDRVTFIHYARTREDFLYRAEVEALEGVDARFIATREGGARLSADDLAGADCVAVCGPPPLIEAARELAPGHVLAETFSPPTVTVAGEHATGTIRFTASGTEAQIVTGTLLEQAEAAGLTPEYGCRMGICHTCTCRKAAGAVKNIRTGEVSDEDDEDIQLCVSVPVGDVALTL